MAKINKYGFRELEAQFNSESACLEYIFNTLHTRKCSCGGEYKPVKGRRQYQCGKCRFQIAPTAGTIFHKSDTPLTLWFKAIFLFSNAKSGYSAKQLERDLNVTYKTAWRILTRIRKSLGQKTGKLNGVVEVDETYFGGVQYGGAYNERHSENMKKKSVIIGAVKRGGEIKANVSPNARAKTIGSFLKNSVWQSETRLLTDESNRYDNVARGWDRESIKHKAKEWARGDVHTNTIEGFWSHIKRSVRGTHKVVSKKYLQSYLDGFVFHYNNRHNDRQRFVSLLGALLPRTA